MSQNLRTTEQDSLHNHLETLTTAQLLQGINEEDKTVPYAVSKCIPQIEALVEHIVPKMQQGGRLFYMGAGTSGRLGIVDASECPPTFGVPHDWVVGIIAGGDTAIRKAVEFAEDDTQQGFKDLQAYEVNPLDTVVGIASSGTTPYVIGALRDCQKANIATACITCNEDAPVIQHSDYPIVAVVGPEFVTGSTRMKSGTAQKLILNMISTTVMIKLGRVKGNKMVHMQLSNNKLIDRGTRMLMNLTGASEEQAKQLLLQYGSVNEAYKHYNFTA